MLSIGNKEITKEYLQTANLPYANLARVMLEETNKILSIKNQNRVYSFFKEDVWATHANKSYSNPHIQFGTDMLESVISDRPRCNFFYCTTMENHELLCIIVASGNCKMISESTRLTSVLLEEVAHILVSGIHGHDSVFVHKFVELWREYFNAIRGKLEIELKALRSP